MAGAAGRADDRMEEEVEIMEEDEEDKDEEEEDEEDEDEEEEEDTQAGKHAYCRTNMLFPDAHNVDAKNLLRKRSLPLR